MLQLLGQCCLLAGSYNQTWVASGNTLKTLNKSSVAHYVGNFYAQRAWRYWHCVLHVRMLPYGWQCMQESSDSDTVCAILVQASTVTPLQVQHTSPCAASCELSLLAGLATIGSPKDGDMFKHCM